ncbi:AGAP005074-PA-like protein [Anopheles sinensis]|uniref:AGAP005074-PA-like protein n=1 Tax=Anopheles sinensis TaxID=74873 RepID=A0A084WJF5_ANOSI|nr:AGAP005074-PA-like protein [Anopheles sinensis]
MAKVSASTHQDPAILDMLEISKKRPPKLKTADRTVSVRIDNYSPGAGSGGGGGGSGGREGVGGGSSPILLDTSGLIVHHSPQVERLSPIPMPKHSPDPSKGFFRGEASPTSLKVEDPWSIARKQFRRSDTLHVYSPSMHQLRKATSFHSRTNSGGSNPDEIVAAPIIRHSSVRHTHIYPREYLVKQDSGGGASSGPGDDDDDEELAAAASAAAAAMAAGYRSHSPNVGTNRRNCHMHRSFNDPQKRNAAFLRRDSVKFHSLGEDMPAEVVERSPREAKKFSSANASLENEIYRSRSNSRTDKKGESFSDFMQRQNSKKYPASTTSLDQAVPGAGGSFRRTLIQHKAHLLSPNPPFMDDGGFKPQKSPIFDQKKSYSLRYKNGRQDARDNFKAKKSKSFIVDVEGAAMPPAPPAIISTTGSPYRKDSMAFTPEEADKIYKASRKLSSSLMLDDLGRTDISPIPMDIMDINYGVIMKTYQMNRQKSLNASRKGRRKFADKKLAAGSSFDDDTESSKKRKRIVCIVMSVFLVLALLSVLAVLVTLTHTSTGGAAGSSPAQTKTQYTFARDTPIHAIPTYMVSKDSPKHYNGAN